MTKVRRVLAPSQITSIEHDGFWLLTEEGEFFVSFKRCPAFSSAKVAQIFQFEQDGDAFYWIELDLLQHPEKYPLIFHD